MAKAFAPRPLYAIALFLLIAGLPLCCVSQTPTSDCDQFSAVLMLRCVSPLIEYTKQYAPAGPIPDPNIICSLYKDYTYCAPASIRERCAHFVTSIDAVYEFVCADGLMENFTRSYRCVASQERLTPVTACGSNATVHLREVALSNVTADERKHMQCVAIRGYLDCVKDDFKTNCGDEGWFIKREVTLRSTTAGVVNCTYDETEDLSKPTCDDVGICHCSEGLLLRGKVCEDVDECANGFGLCSQTCTNTIGSYVCSCDTRYFSLADDKHTCIAKDTGEPLSIFFAHGQSIWNISEDGQNFQLVRAGLQKVAMLDLDVEERRIYYVDIGANNIQRLRLEGAFPQTIQDFEVEGTEGIAVDWIAEKLYTVQNTDIMVQELDGRFQKMLYTKVFKLPRALSVYPQIGYMYATDWGQQPFIARAAMDGSEFEVLFKTGLVWPNGLTVDYYANKLYWADAFLDTIECSQLDGSDRRLVLHDSQKVPHVFAMAIMGDYLYWTDWTHSSNPCKDLTCAQLCLIAPAANGSAATGKCACADGFQLNVTTGACVSNCDAITEIQCMGRDPKCISKKYLCDGVVHCKDRSDEKECRKYEICCFLLHPESCGCRLSLL